MSKSNKIVSIFIGLTKKLNTKESPTETIQNNEDDTENNNKKHYLYIYKKVVENIV